MISKFKKTFYFILTSIIIILSIVELIITQQIRIFFLFVNISLFGILIIYLNEKSTKRSKKYSSIKINNSTVVENGTILIKEKNALIFYIFIFFGFIFLILLTISLLIN